MSDGDLNQLRLETAIREDHKGSEMTWNNGYFIVLSGTYIGEIMHICPRNNDTAIITRTFRWVNKSNIANEKVRVLNKGEVIKITIG